MKPTDTFQADVPKDHIVDVNNMTVEDALLISTLGDAALWAMSPKEHGMRTVSPADFRERALDVLAEEVMRLRREREER